MDTDGIRSGNRTSLGGRIARQHFPLTSVAMVLGRFQHLPLLWRCSCRLGRSHAPILSAGTFKLRCSQLRSSFASFPRPPYNRSFIPKFMIHFPVPEALTFDDVSTPASPLRSSTRQYQHADASFSKYSAEHSDHQRRHGHRDRVAHGDSSGAARRSGHHPSQPDH